MCKIIRGLILVGIIISLIQSGFSQLPPDDESIWASFRSWVMTFQGPIFLKDYKEILTEKGVSEEEAKRRLEIIQQIFVEQPEKGIEITYDRIFSQPLTGDPEKDGFTSTPSEYMMESVASLEQGTALDIGAGQGRNSVWLAQQGWDVTAIDISGEGLAAAVKNAAQVDTTIKTVKTTYQEFDYGQEKWDLIVMILSWAQVSDPDYIARLHASLREGGILVFEHVLKTDKQSFPPVVQALAPNELLAFFKDFYIRKYEEGVWPGDWGGPPAELVRMVARKK